MSDQFLHFLLIDVSFKIWIKWKIPPTIFFNLYTKSPYNSGSESPWRKSNCCVLCFTCVYVCSLLPCGHLLGKGWPLGYCWWCLLYFCYFPMWYPGSDMALDCILSWSLPSFLLLEYTSRMLERRTAVFFRASHVTHNVTIKQGNHTNRPLWRAFW